MSIPVIGVYRIHNRISGKSYYGSSVNCRRREKQHFRQLAAGEHSNTHLQASFTKHGRDAFVFEVVEKCLEHNLRTREQVYLDTALSDKANVYNVASDARCPPAWRDRTPEQQEQGREWGRRRMSEMHADPVFRKATAERGRKTQMRPDVAEDRDARLREMNADPAFTQGASDRMKALHADPVFAAARDARIREMQADPIFAKANSDRMKQRHADPAFEAKCAEGSRRRLREMHTRKEALKAPLITRIVHLSALGWQQKDIAKDVGLSRSTVSARLKKLGTIPDTPKPPKENT